MRLLFAGTPAVAIPSLEALVGSSHEVCAVLTRPDAPVGRGRSLARSAVGARADELGIPVWTPVSLRAPEFVEALRDLSPDACPIVAYGGLVPPEALSIPVRGWINLHFSRLPAWRGAAPVQHALLHSDTSTGATTFLLEEGLDTGPILGGIDEQISARDTAGDLLDRLAMRGAELLLRTLDAIADGSALPIPQDDSAATMAPKIGVEDARIDWHASADSIDRLVRACTPAPGAWTTFRDQRLKVLPVVPVTDRILAPGAIEAQRSSVHVGTGTTPVALGQVCPQGRNAMAAADWARGARLGAEESLT